MPTDDKKTKAKLVKRASHYGKAFSLFFATPGEPSRRSAEAMKKHGLAMVRYDLRLKLASERSDELLNAAIPNKGSEYVAVYREEKLRALLRKYKIGPSTKNAYRALPRHPAYSHLSGVLLANYSHSLRLPVGCCRYG
jgi:hypothetical protein